MARKKKEVASRGQGGVAQRLQTPGVVQVEAAGGREPSPGGALSPPRRYVVGIGASAGGLQSLEKFFDNMPPDSGLAFVLVQHLSPDFKSLMDELLSRHTEMALYRVEEGMPLEPNSVYLIPPKKNLVISKNVFELTDQDLSRGHPPNFPIDMFFQSLAANLRERAICVILSGSGSDGTRGVRAVHEVGGVVLVEDPETAQLDGMPRSAIATGIADHVLPAAELARVIYDYAKKAPGELTNAGAEAGLIGEAALKEITSIISSEEQIDFAHYKPSTLGRRIERRRIIVGCDTVDAYISLLQESQDERLALRNDVLIRVTSFFRDPEAWAQLEKLVMPRLVAQTPESAQLRIWVTACSSGEEAYSIAMLAQEALEAARKSVDVKIFATDIDGAAIQRAASGVYPESITQDVSEQRVRRFFKKQGQSYQVTRQLREMLIFAQHGLTRDPPFTRMHLVTCRNTLIYMQLQLQHHLLRMLHFALQPKGVLFLGPAETVGDLEQEFATINPKWRIFEKKRDVRLPVSRHEPLSVRALDAPRAAAEMPPLARVQRQETLISEAFGAFLRNEQAICLLVTPNHELLQVFGDPHRLLHIPEGKATVEVTKMVPKGLALPLHTALHQARKKDQPPVAYRGVEIKQDDQTRYVDLRVTYHRGSNVASDFLMILLQDAPAPSAMSATTVQFDADSQAAQRIADLEQDLQQTKENLQATIEELETTNEEQQATNQELLASNEELQSTNEELQSVNEELYTVNAEYQKKIHELTQLNDDMANLLRSTDIGTVFLDQDLRIRKFTPAATTVINLMEHDVGRPIDHISYGITIDQEDLLAQLKRVLETDVHVERNVESHSGAALLIRIHPYRDEKGQTKGVVLTFVDISKTKEVERALKVAEAKYHDLYDNAPAMFASLDAATRRIVQCNHALATATGYTKHELIGRDILDVYHPCCREDAARAFESWCQTGELRDTELQLERKDGSKIEVSLSMSAVRDEQGRIVESRSIWRDTTERKRAEEVIEKANAELARKNAELEQFVDTVSHDLRSPIVTIQGFIGRFKGDAERGRTDRLGSFAQRIEDAAAHMRQNIDELLELSRIGHVTMKPEIVSTLELVQRVVEDHAEEIKARHVSVEIQPDLPPVFADPARLLRVVDNLIANALKHGCRGDAARIRIGGTTGQNEVRLFVQDNGPGIPPEYQQRIFGLFEKLDRDSEGTGVGLAIVKRIAESHQGRVWVESATGQGATFGVAFPQPATAAVSAARA